MPLDALGRVTSRRWRLRPVFVVGAGRSGTGVLKRALGRHPATLACDGESPLVSELALSMHSLVEGEDLRYYRSSLKIPADDLTERLRGVCAEAALGPHFGLRPLAREVIRSRKRPGRLLRWCAKTFPTEPAARCLLELYPEARFVYIVRNGLDVVYSRTRFPAMRHLPFEDHCRVWTSSVEKYRYMAALPEAHTIRQEDLLGDPAQVLGEVFDHLGLPRDANPPGFLRTTLVHSLDQQTRQGVDVRRVLGARPRGYESWGSDERLTFKRMCAPAMEELGYDVPF